MDGDGLPDDDDFRVLYPLDAGSLPGLPKEIERAYEAAQRVRAVDANAYGVLLGRLLELVCQNRQAAGRSLAKKIENLASRGDIPGELVGVATSLKKLRNIGAHADLGGLTKLEIPILHRLCVAILEYLYGAPYLVKQAEAALERLETSKRHERGSAGS